MIARLIAWQKPLALTLAWSVLGIAVVPPLVHVLALLLASGQLVLLESPALWGLLFRSLLLASTVTVIAVPVGMVLGLTFAKADVPGRRALLAVHLLVAFLPPFLPALGWFRLVGQGGIAQSETLSKLLFSEVGVVFVVASCLTPVATALTWIGLLGVDPSLEEAARLVASPLRTALLILVPCAWRTIALGGLVIFALAVSELGVPMFLRVRVFPALVFSRLAGMDFAPGEAAMLVLPLLLVGVALFALARWGIGSRPLAIPGVRARRPQLLWTGSDAAAPAAFAVAGAALSVAPLAALALDAARGASWSEIRRWAGDSPWNTLRSAAIAAMVTGMVALIAGHGLARGQRGTRLLDSLATLAFLTPSTIIGLGLMATWNRPSTSWLYGSFWILVVGFIAKYAVVAIRAVSAVVAQMPGSMEDAGRTVGAGYLRRLWGIVIRGNARGLTGALLLVAVFSMRDLETAVLFYPPGGEPLTVRIFTLEANGPPAVVSALAVLHVAMTGVTAGAAALLLLRRSRS